MKKKFLITVLSLFIASHGLEAQSQIERLFNQKQFKRVAAEKSKSNQLAGTDLFRVGQSLMFEGDDTAAIRILKLALQKGATGWEVHHALGIAYLKREKFGSAIASFDRALQESPNRKVVLLDKAEAYLKAEDNDRAYETFETIKKYFPETSRANFMLCFLEQERENYLKALDCYLENLAGFRKDSPYREEALANIFLLQWQRKNDFKMAEHTLQMLRQDYPNNGDYLIWEHQFAWATGNKQRIAETSKLIKEFYMSRKLSNHYYKTGSFVKEEWANAQYRIEVFEFFDPQKQGGNTHKAFLLNADGSRAITHYTALPLQDEIRVISAQSDTIILPHSHKNTYTVFREFLKERSNEKNLE